jgi:anti-sigma factor RsiW
MSPFIDSMASPENAERVESHVTACEPCQRQLQSYISMRNLVAGIEAPPLPEDLVLETRVRLSHARNRNFLMRFENRISNLLKPMVVPVLLGTSMTMLLFGTLLGSIASRSTVLAQDRIEEPPLYPLFQPVRTENPNWVNWIRSGSKEKQDLDEPLTMEI